MFTKEEYERIAKMVKKWPNVVVLSDEVYEFSCFDNRELIRFANIEGMAERTLTIGSFGKTFCAVGWRCGFGIGPEHLIMSMRQAASCINYTSDTLT